MKGCCPLACARPRLFSMRWRTPFCGFANWKVFCCAQRIGILDLLHWTIGFCPTLSVLTIPLTTLIMAGQPPTWLCAPCHCPHFVSLVFAKGKVKHRIFKVINLKRKSEIKKTLEQSSLEPETIRSRIFGLFPWAICELTNAGGKKIDEIISVTATNFLYQHSACKRSLSTDKLGTDTLLTDSLRTERLSFRAFQVERRWWAS